MVLSFTESEFTSRTEYDAWVASTTRSAPLARALSLSPAPLKWSKMDWSLADTSFSRCVAHN